MQPMPSKNRNFLSAAHVYNISKSIQFQSIRISDHMHLLLNCCKETKNCMTNESNKACICIYKEKISKYKPNPFILLQEIQELRI